MTRHRKRSHLVITDSEDEDSYHTEPIHSSPVRQRITRNETYEIIDSDKESESEPEPGDDDEEGNNQRTQGVNEDDPYDLGYNYADNEPPEGTMNVIVVSQESGSENEEDQQEEQQEQEQEHQAVDQKVELKRKDLENIFTDSTDNEDQQDNTEGTYEEVYPPQNLVAQYDNPYYDEDYYPELDHLGFGATTDYDYRHYQQHHLYPTYNNPQATFTRSLMRNPSALSRSGSNLSYDNVHINRYPTFTESQRIVNKVQTVTEISSLLPGEKQFWLNNVRLDYNHLNQYLSRIYPDTPYCSNVYYTGCDICQKSVNSKALCAGGREKLMWCLNSLFKKLEPQAPHNDGELGHLARSEINLNLVIFQDVGFEMFECSAGVFVELWNYGNQEAAKMILRRACDKTFDIRCLVSYGMKISILEFEESKAGVLQVGL